MTHLLRPRVLSIAATLIALPLFVAVAMAAESTVGNDDRGDPPDRVARLSYIQGHLAMQSEEGGDWDDVAVNRPLTTGDRLRLQHDARAELQIGSLDVQLDANTDFSFLELTDDVAQIRLTEGAAHLIVRRMAGAETIEVDTPQAAIAITKPGEYSISLRDGGARTAVKVYSGEANVSDNEQNLAVKTGQQAEFLGPEASADKRASIEPVEPRNGFDSWARDREQSIERSASSKYVAPDVIGYNDLDNYGNWEDEGDYGHVWYPTRVAVDWSPYRYGHWVWVAPWGWTWVDDAPWGFAPFHYGRWASVRGRWCWVPGPVHVRAVYAPALVAWVGSPPPRGISVSVSFGSGIGWFPLAPREVYVPGYHYSRNYIYNVNYSNTVAVNRVYINRVYNNRATYFDHVNRHIGNAVTVMKPEAFAASRPVRDHMVRVDQHKLDRWRSRNFTLDVRPERANAGVHVVDRHPQREVIERHRPIERPSLNPNFNRPDNFARERERHDDSARSVVTRVDRPNSERPNDRQATGQSVGQPGLSQPGPRGDSPQIAPRVRLQEGAQNNHWQPRNEIPRAMNNSPPPAQSDARNAAGMQRHEPQRADQRTEFANRERENGGERRAFEQRIEQRRTEQPRFEQPRTEQPRIEAPRQEQPRAMAQDANRFQSQRPRDFERSQPQRTENFHPQPAPQAVQRPQPVPQPQPAPQQRQQQQPQDRGGDRDHHRREN